jgi:AmiR/NasT family two-component response regulator
VTTAAQDKANVFAAFGEMCDGYLVKPIDKPKLLTHLRSVGLVN